MGKGSRNDKFLPQPSLIQAAAANPLKTLFALGVTYWAGAFIGKQRSITAVRTGTKRIQQGVSAGVDFAKDRMEQRKASGSSNVKSIEEWQEHFKQLNGE